MEEQRRKEIKMMLDHFGEDVPSNEDLQDFCKGNKIKPITSGEYEDFLVQKEHDRRIQPVLPKVLKLLGKMKMASMFDDDETQEKIKQHNSDLEIKIAEELEALRYNDIEPFMGQLIQWVNNVLQNGKNRAENAAMQSIYLVAQDKFGKYLEMKDLINYAKQYDQSQENSSQERSQEGTS